MDSIVIKVKYGDTLRRFNADIFDDIILELDMDKLRMKIVELFRFAPDTDLTLTYTDEDGDIVTLVDDDDIRDVTRQRLNPLRITVQLNSEKGSTSNPRSSVNSTPLRSPRVQHHPLLQMIGVDDALKHLPEETRQAVSKILPMVLGAAASWYETTPSLLANLYQRPQPQAGADSSTQTAPPESPKPTPQFNLKQKEVLDDTAPELLPETKDIGQTSKSSQEDAQDIPDVTRGVGASAPVNTPVVASKGTNGDLIKKLSCFRKPGDYMDAYNACGPRKLPVPTLGTERQSPSGSGNSTASINPNLFHPCPFVGIPLTNDQDTPLGGYPIGSNPFKRSYNHVDGLGGIFHKGVRCDGCGVHPITGPRFKSKVKDDYDLCSICYVELGNEEEYFRIDRPMSYRHQWSYNHPHPHPRRVRPPTIAARAPKSHCEGKQNHHKLDSHFILDVNVEDGTMMAPLTPFTKIWLMHNNGNVAWPQGTRLVWIGGDRFSDELSVEIEIPVDGVPAGKEHEVAVDFRAPEQPGRYISYWRMQLPSGHKFGQRVWVLIQVEPALEDSIHGSFRGLNLNLPPKAPQNEAPPTAVMSPPGPENSPTAPNISYPIVENQPIRDQELKFPINDALLVGNSVFGPSPYEGTSCVSYPIIDVSALADTTMTEPQPVAAAPNTNMPMSASEVEESLLKELEAMGFKQVDLNKEILRINDYNLAQSVDDLCGAAYEWDTMLEELEAMGFYDKEKNKRLLTLNNGSLKRVVMELIADEKA